MQEAQVTTVGVLVAVLGPCSVTITDEDGTAAEVDVSPVARRLLARLALDRGRVVSVDELSEAVWGDDRPRTARASLHNQISRIRRVLGEAVVMTSGDGYVLEAATDAELAAAEVGRAERLLLADRPERAHDLAETALARWRGRALAELADDPEVAAFRRHLHELRGSAENLRLAAALHLGRVAWAVPEAERLVAGSPLDEHRWTLLVEALDRAGRRGEALGAFDRARLALRDGIGLDPGPALRAAEATVLDHPDLRTGRPRGPLVGRSAEVDRLVAIALDGGRAVVRGEDGSGKSAVLDEVARHLRVAGRAVATTHCTANPATALSSLRDLLEDLRLEPDPVLGPVNGFLRGVTELAGRRPVVLVVDDLHLAGPSTRATLTGAAEHPGVALLCSVGTFEGGDGLDLGTEVVLGPLDRDAVASLAQQVLGESGPPAATTEWLVEQSGGNPLYLQQLLDEPVGPDSADSPSTGSTTALADLVRRRLAPLHDAARAALEATAVCGPDAPAALLAELAPATGLDAATATGLLVAGPSGALRFRHGAVARVVYADLPPGRRTELHHVAGATLDRLGARAAQVAHHRMLAVELDPTAASATARAAAEEATAHGAHRDAAHWYERSGAAADVAGSAGAGDRVRAVIGRGDALRQSGDEGHVDVLFDAADQATALGDAELLGEAAFALLQLGGTTQTGALDTRAAEVAERALAQLEDPEQRAVVAAAASLTHSMTGHPDRCRALFLEAESQATTTVARRRVLPFAYLALGHPTDIERRDEVATELVALGRASDDAVASFEGHHLSFSVGLQRAQGDRVRSALAEMEGLVERVGDVGRRWALRYQGAAVAHLDDDLDRSEQLAEDALALFAPVSASRATATYGGQLLAIRLAQGRLAELAPVLAGLVEDQPSVPAWHAAYALSLVDDDPDRARHHASRALDDVPDDFTWLAGHVIGARAAARVGDPATLAAYRTRLDPHAGLVCWQGTCAYGPVDTARAVLAAAAGDHRAARTAARSALAAADALGAPTFRREVEELGLG